MGFGHGLALENMVDRVAKGAAGQGLAVARGGVVELTPVRELAVGVEEEEVGRAGGVVALGDLLRFVEQVREVVAGGFGLGLSC